MPKIYAPFTPEQVQALHLWQANPNVHSFTCGNDACSERISPEGLRARTVLRPTTDGWVCPQCDYTQNWAHDFMAGPDELTRQKRPPAWPAGHFAGADGGVGHILAKSSPNCPQCGSPPSKHTVRNYDEIWRDGDVVCTVCDTKVRDYDAG